MHRLESDGTSQMDFPSWAEDSITRKPRWVGQRKLTHRTESLLDGCSRTTTYLHHPAATRDLVCRSLELIRLCFLTLVCTSSDLDDADRSRTLSTRRTTTTMPAVSSLVTLDRHGLSIILCMGSRLFKIIVPAQPQIWVESSAGKTAGLPQQKGESGITAVDMTLLRLLTQRALLEHVLRIQSRGFTEESSSRKMLARIGILMESGATFCSTTGCLTSR